MAVIRLDELPLELSAAQAIEAAYRPDLDEIAQRLGARLSVLIECDKAIAQHLYVALRDRLSHGSGLSCHLVGGHPRRRLRPDDPSGGGAVESDQGYLRTFLNNLRASLEETIGRDDVVVVLPHLDLLTTTTKSGLTDLAKETLAWAHENPDVLLLAFKDPSFEVPKAVEDLFTVRYPIIGLRREAIGRLLCRPEARKFAEVELNPYRFFKYVSGLNAVRFRRAMRRFDDAPDYDPARPETVDRLYRQLRQMTLVADFEVPSVDLHRDIGGYGTIKQMLEDDVLALLRRRDELTDDRQVAELEEVIPRGIIFYGPPGTGKTFFAKALATSLDATIQIVSGPELKERWVGASEENLRRVFTQARKSAPSIIVFDELDSIASRRGLYFGSGVEHSLVNQLLTELDGFRGDELVFVVGTTNFPSSLDPALLRPGRFEMLIEVPYPDADDRREILGIYRQRFNLDLPDDVLDYLVERTEDFADAESQLQFTGDHLYAACRSLKRKELRSGRFTVTRREVDAVLVRKQHGTLRVTEAELRTVAYHEVGHAVCSHYLPHTPGVRKISILPGEMNLPALGVMLQQARENRHLITREEFVDHIAMSLGGRLCEELVLGTVSNGAQIDLVQASALARLMVEELGMGERTGNQSLRLPSPGSERRPMGEQLAEAVDADVRAILDFAEGQARQVLSRHRAVADRLVRLLLAQNVLEDEQLAEVWAAGE